MSWEVVARNIQTSNLAYWWTTARKTIPKDAGRCFDTLVVLVCWLLWKERNNRTFDRRLQTIQDVLARIANEIVVWYQASFRRLEVAAGVLGRLSGRIDVHVTSVMCFEVGFISL